MMRWATQLLWLCWLIGPAAAVTAEELPREWQHWSRFRELSVASTAPSGDESTGNLVRVPIPEDLFSEARSDLADLRIVDERGEDVGFVVFTWGTGPAAEWRAAEMIDVGFVAGEYTQVVADTGGEGILHNAVEVTLPRDDEELFTWVEISASDDRETWRTIRPKAPLYRFRERGFGPAVGLSYPRTRDRWLRLRLLEGRDEVAIERLRVSERVEEEGSFKTIRRALVRSADSPEGESWWQPMGEMPAVPIAAARFETDRPSFHRPVEVSVSSDGRSWRQVGRGNIYRYQPEEGAEEVGDPGELRQSLQIEVSDTAAPFWRVTVLERSDPPIQDLAVNLMQNVRYAVFRPRTGGSYRLVYGNARAKAPEYELEQLVSRDALAAARLVELGEARVNDAWVSSEPFSERHPVILWLALGLAVVVIAAMALRTLRQAA